MAKSQGNISQVNITNTELWNIVRDRYPNFRSHTAEGTSQLFTEKGYEHLRQLDNSVLNDFFQLSMRVYLQLVNISHARDILEEADFGEYYDMPQGAYIQRMAINSILPISPAYKNLQDLQTGPDPFVVRKPTATERFFDQNFDYASLITIPDEFAMKQIFLGEYGMSEFMGGIMEGLQNGYTLQVYVNKLEAMNAAINSTTTPLQETQKVTLGYASNDSTVATSAELLSGLLTMKNIIQAISIAPQTGAYNALGFKSTQDMSRLRLLIRPGWRNRIELEVLRNSYQAQVLNLDVPIITVPNFGGLTSSVAPTYDSLGAVSNQAAMEAGTWTDPNADVVAVLADKGIIFTARQNPYQVEPIRNPRGLYTNYWASSPNNTIKVDPLYNMVVFYATGATAST